MTDPLAFDAEAHEQNTQPVDGSGADVGTPENPVYGPSGEFAPPPMTPEQEVEYYGGSQEYLQILQGMGSDAVNVYLEQLRYTRAADLQEIQENVDPAGLSQSAMEYIGSTARNLPPSAQQVFLQQVRAGTAPVAFSPSGQKMYVPQNARDIVIEGKPYLVNWDNTGKPSIEGWQGAELPQPEVVTEETEVEDYNTAVKDYITAVGGSIEYYDSLADADKRVYLQQLQNTGEMDIEEYIGKVGGNLDYYKGLAPTDQQIYLQQLANTQEMDVAEFQSTHVQVGNDEWMLKSDYKVLPGDIKAIIDKEGVTGYLEKIKQYENTLAPYYKAAGEGMGTEGTLRGEIENPAYYDLSLISYEDAQNPTIREAVAAYYPSLNLDQLGKMPIEKSTYEWIRDHPENKFTKIILESTGKGLNQYYPIQSLSIADYQNKKQALIDSGLSMNEVKKTMSNYTMVTGNVDEYWDYANSEDSMEFRPSYWQQMTPWDELKGETVTLKGGSEMAANILVPGYFVANNWKSLSGGEKALNITLDVVSIIPFIGAASLGARGVSTASRGARAVAIGEAVAREAASQVKAPVTMLIHPIGTVKATYRTLADMLEDVLDPRKLGEAVITTSNHTVKIRIGPDVPLSEAMRIRNELATLVSQGEKPVVEIVNDAGNGVRIELAQSPLMKEVGGGMVSGTPYGSEWMQQIKTQGYASVAESSEGGRMFFSAEPHPRFAFSTAAGEEGARPTMMIFGKDNPLIAKLENSGKLYNAPGIGLTAEIEKTAPAGTLVWSDVPQQVLYTRVGANREIMEIWLDSALTPTQIAKLKAMNLIERIKAPFKAPISVTRIGEEGFEGLTEQELRAIANIIEEGGNVDVAASLRRFISESDMLRPAAGLMRRNPMSLDRYDPITGQVYREGEIGYYDRITGTRELPSRLIPNRVLPMRQTPVREIPERITPTRIEAVRETPERTEPERAVPERVAPERIPPDRIEPGREIPSRIIPDRTEIPREQPPREYPPRIQYPPRYPSKSTIGVGELSKKQLEGSVAWKQGWCYKLIYPPYGQENIINSKKPFPNMRIHRDARSAFKTLIQVVDGTLPPSITRDMGIMDITIDVVDNPDSKVKHTLAMKYKRDQYQQTQTTPKIVRG